jgi:hypothetical protein
LGTIILDPLLTGFVLLFIVPHIGCALGLAKHLVERFSHFELQTLEPQLHLALGHEVLRKVDLLLVLRVHTIGNATVLCGIGRGFESESLETVEAISDELAHLGRILTVG